MSSWARFAAAILTMTLAAGALPGVAAASAATSETFILQRDSAGLEDGWHTDSAAPEAFTDSGPWASDFHPAAAIPSPVTFEGLLDVILTGSQGAIYMQFQVHLNLERGVFDGTWQIKSGTGAYQSMLGQGTWSVAVDPQTHERTYTCAGSVHFG